MLTQKRQKPVAYLERAVLVIGVNACVIVAERLLRRATRRKPAPQRPA
jgi:hypothetical protein